MTLRSKLRRKRGMMRSLDERLVGASFRFAVRRPCEWVVGEVQGRMWTSVAQIAKRMLPVILNMIVRIGVNRRSRAVETAAMWRTCPRARCRELTLDLTVAEAVLLRHRLRRLRAVGAHRVYARLPWTEAATTAWRYPLASEVNPPKSGVKRREAALTRHGLIRRHLRNVARR
jgi:hypothetical protein